ncbi:unnamed protein product [Effrenium voratum]|nr:unnamed protein product [Effrenium voratum]
MHVRNGRAPSHVFLGGSGDGAGPREVLRWSDAWGWLQGSNDIFDVIILDFPDAFDNVMLEKLYSQEFYRLCRAHMHAGSVLVAQTGPCTQVARSGFRAQCPVPLASSSVPLKRDPLTWVNMKPGSPKASCVDVLHLARRLPLGLGFSAVFLLQCCPRIEKAIWSFVSFSFAKQALVAIGMPFARDD